MDANDDCVAASAVEEENIDLLSLVILKDQQHNYVTGKESSCTPVVVTHLYGNLISNQTFDNCEYFDAKSNTNDNDNGNDDNVHGDNDNEVRITFRDSAKTTRQARKKLAMGKGRKLCVNCFQVIYSASIQCCFCGYASQQKRIRSRKSKEKIALKRTLLARTEQQYIHATVGDTVNGSTNERSHCSPPKNDPHNSNNNSNAMDSTSNMNVSTNINSYIPIVIGSENTSHKTIVANNTKHNNFDMNLDIFNLDLNLYLNTDPTMNPTVNPTLNPTLVMDPTATTVVTKINNANTNKTLNSHPTTDVIINNTKHRSSFVQNIPQFFKIQAKDEGESKEQLITSEQLDQYIHESQLLLNCAFEQMNVFHDLNNAAVILERSLKNLTYLGTLCDINDFNNGKFPDLNDFI